MARTITVQITLDEEITKSAEAALNKIGMDMGGFFAWSLKNVAAQGAAQKAPPGHSAGGGAEKAAGESRLAAWEEFKKKHKGSIKADLCWKTELAKARDEKYADYV